mmetsp:Transcript_43410/g.92985  ORF Transcript_43410/g.92985 Transcript_43410/m.92985 type:complete len:431 (-) Transcript_43410:82-1374(-)
MAAAGAAVVDDAPWHVEVPESQLNLLLGPNKTTLARLCKATGCEIEPTKVWKGKQTKSVSYGGQTQYYEDADEDGGKTAGSGPTVKVFIRGAAAKRRVAAEVLKKVAEGEDPEDHAARAEGAVVFEHDMIHPDRQAWARWRLLPVARSRGLSSHLGRRTGRLTPLEGPFSNEAASLEARRAAEEVIREANELVELHIDALDTLEPEEAPTDPSVLPLVDQYGLLVRVADQDDNAISEYMKIRLFGPSSACSDAAELLKARFVDGKATASILQLPKQMQSLPGEHLKDFEGDLQALQEELQVSVQKTDTMFWLTGTDPEAVAEAKHTLQEMLQFYNPTGFLLVESLEGSVLEGLLADEELGVLMGGPDCIVTVDLPTSSLWICGGAREAVLKRLEVCKSLAASNAASEADVEDRPKKRRRTDALSVHSEVH